MFRITIFGNEAVILHTFEVKPHELSFYLTEPLSILSFYSNVSEENALGFDITYKDKRVAKADFMDRNIDIVCPSFFKEINHKISSSFVEEDFKIIRTNKKTLEGETIATTSIELIDGSCVNVFTCYAIFKKDKLYFDDKEIDYKSISKILTPVQITFNSHFLEQKFYPFIWVNFYDKTITVI